MAAVAQDLTLLLDRRVAALRKAQPDLADALELQAQLIRASLTAARAPLAHPFALPREQLTERIRRGVPLLHNQPAQVDVHFAADLFSRLAEILAERDDPQLRSRLDELVAAATSGLLDPERLFGEAFVQHEDHLAEMARQVGVDAELLGTLAGQAVAPLLRAYADHLLPLMARVDDGTSQGAAWQQGYCPVCGAWPILAELRGVELARYLRCAACGAGWRSPRLFCAYCANEDYQLLGTLTIEGEQRFRIGVCERCKGYLKVCNAFDPPPAALLALEDAASVHLDVAAIERGYHRPAGPGYAIELGEPEDEWVEELG
jgi:FdhE protein